SASSSIRACSIFRSSGVGTSSIGFRRVSAAISSSTGGSSGAFVVPPTRASPSWSRKLVDVVTTVSPPLGRIDQPPEPGVPRREGVGGGTRGPPTLVEAADAIDVDEVGTERLRRDLRELPREIHPLAPDHPPVDVDRADGHAGHPPDLAVSHPHVEHILARDP